MAMHDASMEELLSTETCVGCAKNAMCVECPTQRPCFEKFITPGTLRDTLARNVPECGTPGTLFQLAEGMHERRASQSGYGDPILGHTQIGLLWTALLQEHYELELDHPIPADVTCLMMAGMKLLRACWPRFNFDNYLDAVVYTQFASMAKELAERQKKEE